MTAPTNYSEKPVLEVTNIHENTAQEIIHITVDRARLVLVQHKEGFEQKKGWHTPLGVFLTIILVFLTSSFKETWGFKAETWSAFFLFLLFATTLWLVRAVVIAFRSASIEDIVGKMKKNG